MDRAGVIDDAVAHFHEHGYAVVEGYLTAEELAPAQAELTKMFPSEEEYFSLPEDHERRVRFGGSQFAGLQLFPYASVEWSLLGLSEPIVRLAEAFLGRTDLRVYEAHNWAKYAGAIDYEQAHHCDYGNHTLTVPSPDERFGEVEMFIYVHDVDEGSGPTRVLSKKLTSHLPVFPPYLPRGDFPDLYEQEVTAAGPAGTVLAYTTSTYHRGADITAPGASRFLVKSSFRVLNDVWSDKIDLVQHLGPDWYAFVNRATPRQLELIGFPPRGHHFWTEETWSGTCLRYPEADLSAFRPA